MIGRLLLPAITALAYFQPAPERGIVIEEVLAGSSAERAGLRPGDTISSWSRADAHGVIDSPLELAAIEIEESPLGLITLEGVSSGKRRVWQVQRQVTGGPQQTLRPWGIVSRPVLPPTLLAMYQRSAEALRAGDSAGAAGLQQAATSATPGSPLIAAWLVERSAEWSAQAGHPKEAYAAFDHAALIAPQPRNAAVLLLACGDFARTQNDWQHAEDCYSRSLLASGKSAPQGLTAAAALNNLGNIANFRGNLAKAEKLYLEALAIRRKLAPGSLDVGRSLNNVALMRSRLGDPQQAIPYLTEALDIQERLAPASLDVSTILLNLGSLAGNSDDLDRAEHYYRRALEIAGKSSQGAPNMGNALNRLGRLLLRRGDLAGAQECLQREIAITSKTPGTAAYARSLSLDGSICLRRGDLPQAEESFTQALAIQQKIAPQTLDVASALSSLGGVALTRGDLDRAEELLLQALAIQQRLAPASPDAGTSFTNLGSIARRRGDRPRARDFYSKALAIWERLAPGGLEVAGTLHGLGLNAFEAGEFSQAGEFYLQSLAIFQRLAPGGLEHSASLSELARTALHASDLSKAGDYYRQALSIQEKLVPGTQHEAITLFGLAIVSERRGEGVRALQLFERAANSLDRQLTRLGGPDEVRSEFRAQFSQCYLAYIEALLKQKQPESAFAVLERSRARSMLTMLAERDLIFAASLPAGILRERQTNAAAYDRTQAELARISPEKDKAQAALLSARLRELASARDSLAERIRRASPRFAALEYPQSLDLDAARQALDDRTVLLSYSITETHSTLFVVQPRTASTGLSVYTLPVGEKALSEKVKEYRSLLADRRPSGRIALDRRARELYDLLIKPAEPQIAQYTRVLLVPDGPLHVLPFAALRRSQTQYLIEWKPLHTIVSASLYHELAKTRNEPRHPLFQLAAFGDPLYPEPVPGRLDLPRLPFSREEVTAIAALYPDRSRVFLGAQATEENAKSAAPLARYLHFAAHAVVDERFPLNSGLAFSPPQKPLPGRENGLLQAWEIFEQLRIEADLVVLSACQTGLGKEIRGEGLIGLTRALQYAGARSIIASLWNVDDLKTSELMKALYQQLERGKSKDQALRAAQLSLLASRSASHPFYWAAFSLIGDWR